MKLELRNVSVTLSGKDILSRINIKIEHGELVSLFGPSGCGKSTLLKTIAGLLYHREGEILFNDKVIDDIPPYKRKAVIVFQDLRLFPHLTIEENIAFPLRMKGLPKKDALDTAAEYISRMKLDGTGKRKPGTLSGGQQQRVALARALAAEPGILLLDEPFSSIDEELRKEMCILVKEVHKEFDITTILVTHDKKEAVSMSDYLIHVNDGQIIE